MSTSYLRHLPALLLGFSLFLSSCMGNSGTTSSNIDDPLLERIASFSDISTFSAMADSTNLSTFIEESGRYTIFVPTDEAFSRLPAQTLDTLSTDELAKVLAYHATDTTIMLNSYSGNQLLESLQGDSLHLFNFNQRLYVNGAQLVAGNYQATNGVFHVTNSVLLPDPFLSVIGLISKRYNLLIMNSALTQAGLVDTLQTGPAEGFTVFAPKNSAFQNFSGEYASSLEDTLNYHIIPKEWRSSDLSSSQMLETRNGQELKVEYNGTTITVNDSITVTQKDLTGHNGVVHVIDSVLIPPSN